MLSSPCALLLCIFHTLMEYHTEYHTLYTYLFLYSLQFLSTEKRFCRKNANLLNALLHLTSTHAVDPYQSSSFGLYPPHPSLIDRLQYEPFAHVDLTYDFTRPRRECGLDCISLRLVAFTSWSRQNTCSCFTAAILP